MQQSVCQETETVVPEEGRPLLHVQAALWSGATDSGEQEVPGDGERALECAVEGADQVVTGVAANFNRELNSSST